MIKQKIYIQKSIAATIGRLTTLYNKSELRFIQRIWQMGLRSKSNFRQKVARNDLNLGVTLSTTSKSSPLPRMIIPADRPHDE
jgi:hypothetical protein